MGESLSFSGLSLHVYTSPCLSKMVLVRITQKHFCIFILVQSTYSSDQYHLIISLL